MVKKTKPKIHKECKTLENAIRMANREIREWQHFLTKAKQKLDKLKSS